MNQRWFRKLNHWRDPDEQIDPRQYHVREIPDDQTARGFVEEHHYSGSYPAARFRLGLFRDERLVGVAVFSHPTNDATLTEVFGGAATESVELGRFVLLNEAEGNAETWFLARCFRVLKDRGLRGVLAHSDPLPRVDQCGHVVKPGHIGTIYKAHNALYLGRTRQRWIWVLKADGQTIPERAICKVRGKERGWEAVVARLLPYMGQQDLAMRPEEFQLDPFLRQFTYKLRHPGNHRYAWSFAKSGLGVLGQVYPKSEGS